MLYCAKKKEIVNTVSKIASLKISRGIGENNVYTWWVFKTSFLFFFKFLKLYILINSGVFLLNFNIKITQQNYVFIICAEFVQSSV